MQYTNVFLALLRSGLWNTEVRLSSHNNLDFRDVLCFAEEQSVVGLVTVGVEKLPAGKLPLTEKLTLLGKCQLIEQRNEAMNRFIAELVGCLQDKDVNYILVKGQGVAQCYEHPNWRCAGDIDFLLDKENYQKAKAVLIPLATEVENEDKDRLHQGLKFGMWAVELHGTMHSGISKKINSIVDEVQYDIFTNNGIRFWKNGSVNVKLPSPDNDVILVFTHFVGHFYGIGIGLRQICDWCRLLWTYRKDIDIILLESRLNRAGLMEEWKVFSAFSVEYLGMPKEAIPFYENTRSYRKKATRVRSLIMETGDLGHNKEENYRAKYPKIIVNIITFFRRLGEFARIATIFPVNAPKFFVTYATGRIKANV